VARPSSLCSKRTKANDRKEAIKEFKRFSIEPDDTSRVLPSVIQSWEFKRFSIEPDDTVFLDCEREDEIRTIEEGREYLRAYLKTVKPAIKIEEVKEDPQLRKKVIAHLRTNIKLSPRKIAEVLGIDKSMVEKIKVYRGIREQAKEPSPCLPH